MKSASHPRAARFTTRSAAPATYGITSERDIILFLNHMYMLSPDFDTNPDFPWASEILNNPSIAPASKMDWLSGRTYHRLGEHAPKEF
jgi:hypothetical protein